MSGYLWVDRFSETETFRAHPVRRKLSIINAKAEGFPRKRATVLYCNSRSGLRTSHSFFSGWFIGEAGNSRSPKMSLLLSLFILPLRGPEALLKRAHGVRYRHGQENDALNRCNYRVFLEFGSHIIEVFPSGQAYFFKIRTSLKNYVFSQNFNIKI